MTATVPAPAPITDRVIATFDDYAGMIAAMRARAQARKIAITSPEVSALTGLPDFYVAKLLSPKAPRRLGALSLVPICSLLCVRLALLEDPIAMARYGDRIPIHDERVVHAGSVHIALSGNHMRTIRRKGGANSRKYMSAREARALARKAARARWRKAAEAA
jgi:hypothetical protein